MACELNDAGDEALFRGHTCPSSRLFSHLAAFRILSSFIIIIATTASTIARGGFQSTPSHVQKNSLDAQKTLNLPH